MKINPQLAGLAAIQAYRFFSPALRAFLTLPLACRLAPSCSEYAESAIRELGLLRGAWAGFKRILRCHPLQKKAADPFEVN